MCVVYTPSNPSSSASRALSRAEPRERPGETKAPMPVTEGLYRGLVGLAGGVRRRARLLGKRGDLERSPGGVLEDVDRLLLGARVELDQEMHHDQLVIVLVEAHVSEELAGPGVPQRAERQAVGGVGARARFHLVLIDRDRARGDERLARDHSL